MAVDAQMIERAEELLIHAYAATDDPTGMAHARAVAGLLAEIGCDEHVVTVGLLHDVVEDTAVSAEMVREAFGARVGELVAALTEDEAVADERLRKQALRASIAAAGHTALLVFAADKLARVRAADESGVRSSQSSWSTTAALLRRHSLRRALAARDRAGPAVDASAQRAPAAAQLGSIRPEGRVTQRRHRC